MATKIEGFALRSGGSRDLVSIQIFKQLQSHFSRQQKSSQVFFFQNELETVIGVEPYEKVRCTDENPFDLISKKMQERAEPPAPSGEAPRFRGGALGYFSYDSARWIEPVLGDLGVQKRNPDAEFVFFHRAVVVDRNTDQVYVMSRDPVHFKEQNQELKALCLISVSDECMGMEKTSLSNQEIPLQSMRSQLGREAFLSAVKKLGNHILEGDIFQAVLSDCFTTAFTGDPFQLFKKLCQISPSPYQFYFSFGDRTFLGASPEMLLRKQGNLIETHPIAGTRPRGATPEEDLVLEKQLLENEKEKAEHLMLVDLARNDLGRVAKPGTVKVRSYMELKKFSGVMHFTSRVTAELKETFTALGALAACFPAGTLSGAPKIRAMQLIAESERSSRGFYGGAVVLASFSGDLDSCISIRSIELYQGQAIVQAGAGIVADSVPENEYLEVEHKTKMARRALAQTLSQSEKGS